MKKQEFKKTLSLNKETIAKLADEKLNKILGGNNYTNIANQSCQISCNLRGCNSYTFCKPC